MAKQPKKKQQRQQLMLIGLGAAIMIAAIGFGVWFFLKGQQAPKQSTATQTHEEKVIVDVENADKVAQTQGVDKGAAAFDEIIKGITDPREKSELIATKATLYLDEKKYDEALRFALEADRLYASASVSALVARVYEAQGNKAQAVVYYKKAATRVDAASPMAQADKSYYNSKVQELGAGQ